MFFRGPGIFRLPVGGARIYVQQIIGGGTITISDEGKHYITNTNGLIRGSANPYEAGTETGDYGSLSLNGTTQAVSYAHTSKIDLGSSDFTIGCTFKTGKDYSGSTGRLINHWANGDFSYTLAITPANIVGFFGRQGVSTPQVLGTTLVNTNTWVRVIAQRVSGTFKIYVNEVEEDSSSITGAIDTSAEPLEIGYRNDNGEYFDGLISEAWIRLDSSIDPTIEPTTWRGATGMAFYASFKENITDESSSPLTFTPVASPQIVWPKGGPYLNSNFGLFSGSDAVTFPDSADFNLGSGDFRIGGWFWTTSDGTGNRMLLQYPVTTTNRSFSVGFNNPAEVQASVYVGSTQYAVKSPTAIWNDGAKHWVVFSRVGDDLFLHIDGNQVDTTSMPASSVVNNSTADVEIGQYNSSQFWDGGLSDWFIIKDSTTIDPTVVPTDYIADTNTVLHVKMSKDFKDSALSPYALPSNVGHFDGVNDQVYYANSSEFDLGSGEWTIGHWMRTTSTSFVVQLSQYSGNTTNDSWLTQHNPTNGPQFVFVQGTTGNTASFGTTPFNDEAWHWVVFRRVVDTIESYVDGVAGDTKAISGAINTSTKNLYMGSNTAGLFDFDGQLADAFIIKDSTTIDPTVVPTAPIADTNTVLHVKMTEDFTDSSSSAHSETLVSVPFVDRVNPATLVGSPIVDLSSENAATDSYGVIHFDGTADLEITPRYDLFPVGPVGS